jgi:hypothetical protein
LPMPFAHVDFPTHEVPSRSKQDGPDVIDQLSLRLGRVSARSFDLEADEPPIAHGFSKISAERFRKCQ